MQAKVSRKPTNNLSLLFINRRVLKDNSRLSANNHALMLALADLIDYATQ